MSTLWFRNDACHAHVTPTGHPERVERLEAVDAALAGLGGLDRRTAPPCTDGDILRAHPQAYLDRLTAAQPHKGWASLDPDTHMSPGSIAAAGLPWAAHVLPWMP